MSAADVSRRWLGGRGRSLGAGLLILASLAVGRVITDRLPDAESVIEKPINASGPPRPWARRAKAGCEKADGPRRR